MNEELLALVDDSINFRFLAEPELLLAGDAALAERYMDSDPDGAMFRARHFGETLAKKLVRHARIHYPERGDQAGRVAALVNAGVIPSNLRPVFDTLRRDGNVVAHSHSGDKQKARKLVEACHQLAVWWFERQSGKPHHLPFQPPRAGESRSLWDLLSKVEKQLQSLQTAFDGAAGRPKPRIVLGAAQPDSGAESRGEHLTGQRITNEDESAPGIHVVLHVDELDGRAVGVDTDRAAGGTKVDVRVRRVGPDGELTGLRQGSC